MTAVSFEDSKTPYTKSTRSASLPQKEQGVGRVAAEYSCYFQNAKGTLYAGSKGVYFVGMVFFFAREMNVGWLDVIKVTKTDDGVSLITRDETYDFLSFSAHDHDRAWATLISLHSDAVSGGGGEDDGTRPLVSPSLRSTIRRTNSDPLSEVHHSPANGGLPSGREGAYVAGASLAQLDDVRVMKTHKLPLYTSMRVVSSPSMRPSVAIDGGDVIQDIGETWAELQNTNESYSDCAVKDHELSCDLQSFFDMFIADDAPHSIPKYMESAGDTEFVVAPWKAEDEDSMFQQRTLEYNHPVNAPLAPPMARARKEQRYAKCGDHGICIETETYVQDVPMTDCFYVTDRILVEPNGEGKVLVMAEFDIRFVKSTMFRAIIANTTRSEFMKWFHSIFEYMTEVTEGKSPEEIAEAQRRKKATEEEEEAKAQPVAPGLPLAVSSSNVMIILLFIVLLMQLWIMWQMLQMQKSMLALQTNMAQSCAAVPKLVTD